MGQKIKKLMPRVVFARLGSLYQRMEDAYNVVAGDIGLSCRDCPDNCCNSFFKHHTRVEWAYFWQGLNGCHADLREKIIGKAYEYTHQMRSAMNPGNEPLLMCPVNFDGRCVLYGHRLMICRLHGVPSTHITPRGQTLNFPGCFRCRERTESLESPPRVDRTGFYHELALLEQNYVGPKIVKMSKVNLTLAEMIVQGPPLTGGGRKEEHAADLRV